MGTPTIAITAVGFPLQELPSEELEVMRRIWERTDLTRYLDRWKRSVKVPVPVEFWEFDKRCLDIGSGLAAYALDQARAHRDTGFLAVDKSRNRSGVAQSRADAEQLANVFVMNTNVIPLLAELPPASLDEVTVFYPNPWWPKKHRKKRWSYHPMLSALTSVLRPGGRLLLCSNEAFYLSEWLAACRYHQAFNGMSVSYVGPIRVTVPRTHFERQFMARGMSLGEIECTRRTVS